MKQFLIKLLASLICFVPVISSAQVWDEHVDLSRFKWSSNNRLQVTSPSLSDLYIWNYNAETKDNLRNNRWQGEDLVLNLNWSQTNRWKISFKISNLHDEYKGRYKETYFTGIYDGDGHTINVNIYVERDENTQIDDVCLFGYISSARILNLGVTGSIKAPVTFPHSQEI